MSFCAGCFPKEQKVNEEGVTVFGRLSVSKKKNVSTADWRHLHTCRQKDREIVNRRLTLENYERQVLTLEKIERVDLCHQFKAPFPYSVTKDLCMKRFTLFYIDMSSYITCV